MKIRLALAITLMPLLAAADIYKSVDSDGHVVFSDKPTPGAKKIHEQSTPTYVPSPLPQAETTPLSATPAVPSYYTALHIRKPAAGETLRDAAGALTIDIEVVPPLKIQDGHKLIVAVDGNNLASHGNATQLTISNLASGAHTLKAQIMDATGQVQFSSERITFQMQRADDASSTKVKVPANLPSTRQGLHP